MVVRRPRTKANTLPTPLVGVERVDVMNVLGVLIDGRLSFREHIDWISTKSAQSLYALRNLRAVWPGALDGHRGDTYIQDHLRLSIMVGFHRFGRSSTHRVGH